MDLPKKPEDPVTTETVGKATTPVGSDHDEKYGVPSLEELGMYLLVCFLNGCWSPVKFGNSPLKYGVSRFVLLHLLLDNSLPHNRVFNSLPHNPVFNSLPHNPVFDSLPHNPVFNSLPHNPDF